MTNKEKREPTREEIVSKWKVLKEQDVEQRQEWQGRKSKDKANGILENQSQYFIIMPTLRQRLGWIPFLLIAVLFLAMAIFMAIFISFVFFVVPLLISIVMMLFVVWSKHGRRVVIDSLSTSITIEDLRFLPTHKQPVIPFSSVTSVDVDQRNISIFDISGLMENILYLTNQSRNPFLGEPAWQVSLNVGGEKVKINHSVDGTKIRYLASKISKLIGKRLIDNQRISRSSLKGSDNTEFDYPSKRPPSYPI